MVVVSDELRSRSVEPSEEWASSGSARESPSGVRLRRGDGTGVLMGVGGTRTYDGEDMDRTTRTREEGKGEKEEP